MKKLMVVALNLLLISWSLWAQEVAPPQISGSVKDTYGKPIAAAEITATQTATDLAQTAVSDTDGYYILRNLPVGPYKVQVSKKGFVTCVKSDIELTINGSPVYNPVLPNGESTEPVLVTTKAALPEARSNGVGQLIDNQRMVDYPLNGRRTGELVLLSGIATAAPAGDLNTNKNYPTTTISVAGGQANATTYILDGGSHNDPFNNLSLPMPFPDALREFKVETGAMPAGYSHHAAATVSIATKSGSNSYHGSAFEFIENDRLNARNYLAAARDNLRHNQFGGTLGGPILHNKLFFFGGYQHTNVRHSSPTATSYVPTLAMLAGDFTGFASSACNTKGRVILKLPFVSNQIPQSSISPQALNILKIIPIATDPCGKIQYSMPDNSREHQLLGRIDYQRSANHSIFGRYYYADYENPEAYDGTNGLTLSKTGVYNRVYSFVLGDQRILSENLTSFFHATVLRTTNDRVVPGYFSPQDVGVSAYGPLKGYMGIGITNGFSLGYKDANPGFFNSGALQLAEDMDWIWGAHEFSFGVNYIQSRVNAVNNRLTNGQYTFDGTLTGLGLADFLTGNLGAFAQGNPGLDYNRHKYIAFYLQDSWKLARRLSLQAGVRWEPFKAITHARGYTEHIDQKWFDDGVDSKIYTKGPNGLLVSGDEGMPKNANYRSRSAVFSYRLGLVWDPMGNGRLMIRASGGILHDTPQLYFTTRFSSSAPWGAQISLASPGGGLANPWRDYSGGNPFPDLNTVSTNMQFPKFGAYVNMPLNVNPTTIEHWNLTIQKILGRDFVLAASYLGNQTVHGWSAYEANPAEYIAGMCAGGKYGLTKAGYCSQTTNTDYRRKLYTKNAGQGQYYSTIAALDDGGTASYHALQLSAQRRLTGRFNLVVNYTLSKCLTDPLAAELGSPTYVNPGKRSDDRGLCATDRHHNLNTSVLTLMPQLKNSNRVVRTILGGWQLATIYVRMTGDPLTITTGVDRAFTGIENQRPDENKSYTEPYAKNRNVNVWLNAKAFNTPERGKLGNLGVGTALGPDRNWNLDVALMKRFRVFEEHRFEVRAEAFNVLNHPLPGNPDTNLSSSTFGRITSAGGDPRIVQLALKYTF